MKKKESHITINEPILDKIGKIADDEKVTAYVVGGYVRDMIISLNEPAIYDSPAKDIDIVVLGDPVPFSKKVYEKLNASGLVVFERFRTSQMMAGKVKVEIVGARKEKYDSNSRKPQVEAATLEDDLARRDFTINAMAVALNGPHVGSRTQSLVDPFHGAEAISNHTVDTPLDPEETFGEDPLRILRAIRFASRFNFSVSPRVYNAIKSMKERLSIVSQERITDEFLKILAGSRPSVGLRLMQETGIMKIVFPEISDMPGVEQRQDHHHKDVFLHSMSVVDSLAGVSQDVWLRFAGLVHDIAKPATKKFVDGIGWTFHGHDEIGARWMKKIFHRLRMPMEHLPYVEKLVRLHLRPMALAVEGVTDSAIRRLLFEAGNDFDDLMKLCRADITSKNRNLVAEYSSNYDLVEKRAREVEEKDRIKNWKPPVNGDEIMQLFGLKPGREVGVLKKLVESAVLDGIIPNDHDSAVDYLKSQRTKILPRK